MIQLATPLALLALLTIPLIVVLHLLRPKRQTITVSSTSLWSEALRERQRGLGLQKLFRNLSLLLLLLAALAAALALADPRWLTPSGEQRDIVIVLDVSASMSTRSGSGTRLDEAKRTATQLLDGLAQGGRGLIMTSGRKAVLRTAFQSDTALLRRTVAAIGASDEAGNPADALALAASLLRSREDGRVYFITDAAFDIPPGISGERVQFRVVGERARNVAITRFDIRAEPGRDDRFQVLLSIRNYTDTALSVPTSIALEQRRLFARNIEVGAGSTRTLVVPFEGKAVGRATADIDIDDDLATDNRAFAVINVSNTLHVLLFSAGNFYLQSVLEALPNVQVNAAGQDSLADLEREARVNDVVIFDRVQPPALPDGNFLLLGTLAPNLPLQANGTLANPAITGIGESALMQGVDLTGVRIDEALQIPHAQASTGTQRLFWSAQSDLALALLDDTRRTVVLGFDINRSNFALQAAFPLFITRALDWLHPQGFDRTHTQIAAGEPYAIASGAAAGELIMRTPSGEGQVLSPVNGKLLYEDTSSIGIYRYTVNDVVRFFAVNLTDAAESDVTPRATSALSAANDATDTLRIDNDGALAVKSLWPQLTVLLLAMLLAEWLLWCSGRRYG